MTTTVTASRDFPSSGSQPTFLPLPYPAISVDAPGKWKADPDLMVYSSGDSITGRSYSVASALVDPTQAQLASAPGPAKTAAVAPDLRLPASYQTTALKRLAVSNTSGQASEFGKVNALATWLSGSQFTYSLAAPNLTSEAGLVNFLTKVRSGFCVQYAYAMTVLTRLLGIPARFVVGYTAGTRLAERQLPGQEHRRARVDRGVLPDPGLDPVRADAGRAGHRERPQLHERRDGTRPARRL